MLGLITSLLQPRLPHASRKLSLQGWGVQRCAEGLEGKEEDLVLSCVSTSLFCHRAVKVFEPLGRESLSAKRSQCCWAAGDLAEEGEVGSSEYGTACTGEIRLDFIVQFLVGAWRDLHYTHEITSSKYQ